MKRQSVPTPPVKELFAQMYFVSASRTDEQHRTQIFKDGSSHCTCESFQYNGECRHTKALRRPYTTAEFAGSFAIALEFD